MTIFDIDEEWDADLRSADPLGFPGYADRVRELGSESLRTGRNGHAVVITGDFSVLGGSMGVVHGEKVVRAVDRAITLGLAVIVEVRSGGARMQEGMLSLIQMARCSAAMGRLRDAGLVSIAVLRHPSTGGVFASYASLCDLSAAQAGATVGFAGPRVAEAFTGESVDGRSHTAETALQAGLVDFVADEDGLEDWVRGALGLLDRPLVIRTLAAADPSPIADEASTSAWDEVVQARRAGRPSGIDVAGKLVSSWTELAGTDPTMRAGLATVANRRVVVIAQDRHAAQGRTRPAGFGLACRAIALAGRLGLPIVSLVDTPGAEPGSDAENDGVARAIAQTFLAMAQVPVPTVGVCVGEGGSGGALALAAADRLVIQRHAVFSVIGAEGAAAILYRDAGRAPQVAEHLKLTSGDLAALGIVDVVVDDDLDATVEAVIAQLDVARPSQRRDRFDEATRRALVSPDDRPG